MSMHTPGPWSVVDGYYPGLLDIVGPSFKITVVTSAIDLDLKDYMARTGDCRLIAAAPDLLEALIKINESLTQLNDSGDVGLMVADEVEIARAAIAKATQ